MGDSLVARPTLNKEIVLSTTDNQWRITIAKSTAFSGGDVATNIGPVDRAIRIWSGAILGPTAIGTVLSVTGLPSPMAPVCGLSALYLFATSLTRYSPLYARGGIDTTVDTGH